MATEIIVTGLGAAELGLQQKIALSNEAARRIVERGGVLIQTNSKRQFRARPTGSQRTSKRTGRTYYVGKGQPPRPTNRTGVLSSSIQVKVSPIGSTGWKSETGPNAFYGPYVEYGTSRMPPYPYMTPGLEQSLPQIEALVREEFTRAMEG